MTESLPHNYPLAGLISHETRAMLEKIAGSEPTVTTPPHVSAASVTPPLKHTLPFHSTNVTDLIDNDQA